MWLVSFWRVFVDCHRPGAWVVAIALGRQTLHASSSTSVKRMSDIAVTFAAMPAPAEIRIPELRLRTPPAAPH
jgi:hypothetical protein